MSRQFPLNISLLSGTNFSYAERERDLLSNSNPAAYAVSIAFQVWLMPIFLATCLFSMGQKLARTANRGFIERTISRIGRDLTWN
jgi:hypothetical protein